MKYLVVYEEGPDNWSAFLPDVPGCVAAGDTVEETRHLIREALALHLESMHMDGEPMPERFAVWAEDVDAERPPTHAEPAPSAAEQRR